MSTTLRKTLVFTLMLVLFLSMPLVVKPQRHTASAQGGKNGKIVFTSYRDSNAEIYVMNADGSNQTRLTNNVASDYNPSWSPDGTRIAFCSERDANQEIYVMNADGSNQTNLTNHAGDDCSPTWSPDGTRIAFSSRPAGNWEIYVMNADGSSQTNLTNNAASDYSPTWSPDGTQIAFASGRYGGVRWEIYVMGTDGSNPIRLTNNAEVMFSIAWSPDGARIAFDSERDGDFEIYVMNADGSNITNLTNYLGRADWHPAWSPDSTQIAFHSDRETATFDIYVMDVDGATQTRLTNDPADDLDPDWYGDNSYSGGCYVSSPATSYQGDILTLTLQCDNMSENVFGFQAGHTITAGASLVVAQASTYTAGSVFQGQSTLVGSNTLPLYALSLQAGGTEATGDFTLGSVDYTAVAPGQATFDLSNLILGDINGETITGVQASPSAATVTIEDLILGLSGTVAPQGYAHADNLTFELEGSPVYANFSKTFVPADGTSDFTYTNIKGHADWLQVDGPSHVTCRETFTFPTDAGNETLPSDLILRAGDVNDDDAIDLTDAAAIGQQYGEPASGELDINHDGIVNILDLIHVGRNYNTAGPTDCTL